MKVETQMWKTMTTALSITFLLTHRWEKTKEENVSKKLRHIYIFLVYND